MTTNEAPRLTRRGAHTRERILRAASDVVLARGAAATSLDDVRRASGASKSQIYRHFECRDDLLRAVVWDRGSQIVDVQHSLLHEVDSFAGLRHWADVIVEFQANVSGVQGCPLGSLANELANSDDATRETLAACFDLWESEIVGALTRVQASGDLPPDADLAQWAEVILAVLQGGFLLTKTRRSTRPLASSLRVTLDALAASASPDVAGP